MKPYFFLILTLLSFAARASNDKKSDLETPLAIEENESSISKFIKHYLPEKMSFSDDKKNVNGQIQNQMEERVANDIFSSGFLKKSSLGKWLLGVKNTISQPYGLGMSNKRSENILKFQLEPNKALAGFRYTGDISSALNFEARDREFQLILSKNLTQNTQLLLKESASVEGRTRSSNINLSCSF